MRDTAQAGCCILTGVSRYLHGMINRHLQRGTGDEA